MIRAARPVGATMIALVLLIATSCGEPSDPVTTDRTTAASATLEELPTITAELMPTDTVIAEGERVCALLAEFGDRPAVGDVLASLLDETWSDPVETDFHPEEIQNSFIATIEGPYVISLAKHFCPDQAVRTNLI